MVTLGRRHGSSRLIHPLVSTWCGGAGLNAVALCKLLGYYWTSESWGCPKISLLANRVWGCLSIQVQKSGDITVFMLWTCGTGHTSSVCVCVFVCVLWDSVEMLQCFGHPISSQIEYFPLEMELFSDWNKGHHSYHGKGTDDWEDSRGLCWAQPSKSSRESSKTPG